MKTIKVSVSYGRTINMGNYESLRLEYSAEAEIDDDLTIGDAFTALRHSLRFEVNEGVGKEMYFLQGGDKPRRKG